MPNDGAFTVGHGAVREDMTSVTIRVCDAATSHEGMAAVSAKRHRADDDDDDDPLALCSLPLSLTNFSIREILKPNFGCGQTTGRHHSAFSVCLPRRRLEATTTLTTTTTTTTTGDVTRRTEATPIRHTTNGKKDKCDKLTGDDGAMTAADPLKTTDPKFVWPAWVYCTRYTDRPSAGPRCRKTKKKCSAVVAAVDEKRPRTAFSGDQLTRLRDEFDANRYLTEDRRRHLADELKLNDYQIKIWFQNKRAKLKKLSGKPNTLALELIEQGLYNHSTMKE